MPKGPIIKLTVDLHKIDRFFPLDYDIQGGFDYDMIIDRQRYDDVEALLDEYHISDPRTIQEFCFIILWMEKEIGTGDGQENYLGKFHQMWLELDDLQDYLMKNRITSITFRGEVERDKPGKALTLKEEINIDRLCDGIRSVFRDEFHHDKQRRKTRGLRTWKRRKMIRIKNNMLNYFTTIPELDPLSLEDQNQIIGRLSELAGLPG